MNPILLSLLVSTVLGGAGVLVQRNSRARMIDAAIQEWAPVIFDVVNNIVQQDPTHPANKAGIFDREFTNIMSSRGIKVTPEILTQARAIAASLHYQDKREQSQIQQQAASIVTFPPMPVPAKTAPDPIPPLGLVIG